MLAPIAVVAAACELPQARTPQALWQLALHGRQCFRRLPPERLDTQQYLRAEHDPDGFYAIEAALIEGYVFDRQRFVVPLSTYGATDLAHWMALDVADRALASLPGAWAADTSLKDRMAVIVANTLTGEFSRANLLRYRWPYVEGRLREAADARLSAGDVQALVDDFERLFKAPFPPPDADSLAGALSNTIAGRIANHFNLRGGAFAVDGACASSLLAVIAACDRLQAGDVDSVVVCAVDLSLDPFELVGFARNGALAHGEMRVFDRQSSGFWPGEGCACVILASAPLAQRQAWPVLGWIRGTGLSTDGQGGLTRPTVSGQLLALQRAWAAAGLDPAGADYFEAHGTGTPTGDPVELSALAQLIQPRLQGRPAVPVGSIKANIGHTKAAAGMAGLLKALSVCAERTVPATTGCIDPHAVLAQPEVAAAVRVLQAPEAITHGGAVVVGVNAFGFGGVNCHVVLAGPLPVGPLRAARPLPRQVEGRLPGELIALQASSAGDLVAQVRQLRQRAATLSRSELIDLAAACQPAPAAAGAWRACLVAATPQTLEGHCCELIDSLPAQRVGGRQLTPRWSWSGPAPRPALLAMMFPGQGMPLDAGVAVWASRFPDLAPALARLAALGSGMDTASVQPRLAEISIASLGLLASLGLRPDRVLGHSFGELSAWYAAGMFDAAAFRQLARVRGRCMQDEVEPSAMLAITAPFEQAQALAARHGVDLACHNAAQRFVLAGTLAAIDGLVAACLHAGVPASRLASDRAFHSRLMQPARQRFAAALAGFEFAAPGLPVLSTLSGELLRPDQPFRQLLADQLVTPVRFAQAVAALGEVDLVIELGAAPGLAPLLAEMGGPACLPMAPLSGSLLPLLGALGAAWVCGRELDAAALQAGRWIRPLRLDQRPLFLASPCGSPGHGAAAALPIARSSVAPSLPTPGSHAGRDPLAVLQSVVCELAGLAPAQVSADARLLADLHLNSIRAQHAVATTARKLGIARLPFNPGLIASATLADIARHLQALQRADAAGGAAVAEAPAGIAPWLRVLSHRWEPLVQAGDAPAGDQPLRFQLDDGLAPLAPALREAIAAWVADDESLPTLLVLPAACAGTPPAAWLARLLQVCQAQQSRAAAGGVLVLQGAQLANGWLRSVAAESPDQRFCALQYETLDSATLLHARHEFGRLARGYSELRLRGQTAQQRRLAPHSLAGKAMPWLPGQADVLLVSGGGKGIGAAAALCMASAYACPVALLGRSPADDPEVAASLLALRATGVPVHYERVDLTDAAATGLALQAIQTRLGRVTALLHAAGINQPRLLQDLTLPELLNTVQAKLASLDHLLQALAPGQLRLLVGFASIIGELGLAGEAHYALANEALVERLRALATAVPSLRCVPICWTAWRQTGMASKLDGVLQTLAQQDTRALDTAEAIAALREILETGQQGEPLIVTGRYGRPIDALQDLPPLHRHRFLAQPRVFYPGIELVADAACSVDTDPWLRDHAPYGLPVLPLVAAIEAMLSAGQCLRGRAGQDGLPVISDLHVGAAVSFAPGQVLVLRTAALLEPDGSVRVSLRSSATDFEVDHFSARLGWGLARAQRAPPPAVAGGWMAAPALIYCGLVFHGPRFQRLDAYQRIDAQACQARTLAGRAAGWHGPLQAPALQAGDPCTRDALLHALQACLPHQPVLPVGVARLELGVLRPELAYTLYARQTGSQGSELSFDVDVFDPQGLLVERWAGLRLARVLSDRGDPGLRRALDPRLLPAFAGRLLLDTLGEAAARVAVSQGDDRAAGARQAIASLCGPQAVLRHRPDGAPQVAGQQVAISHSGPLTLALAHAQRPVACDLQTGLPGEPADWPRLLGAQRWAFASALSQAAALPLAQACLVSWTASECLQKLGCDNWPLAAQTAQVSDAPFTGPIVHLQAPGLALAIGLLRLAGQDADTALAVALGPRPQPAVASPAAAAGVQGQGAQTLADTGD